MRHVYVAISKSLGSNHNNQLSAVSGQRGGITWFKFQIIIELAADDVVAFAASSKQVLLSIVLSESPEVV